MKDTPTEHPAKGEQPEDLREQLERVLLDKTRTNGTAQLATISNEILRLCEAAALAALPEKQESTALPLETTVLTAAHLENVGKHIDDLNGVNDTFNKAIATAQANIHSVFGGIK
jgi:hypothetical protein